ncbi:MAG: hypothetical protein J6W29_03250 [Neisseriaceae bacterium]|nr:hypothetical protein [Neisseriaceae bacterium]
MESKNIEVEGVRVKINPAPATVGYDVALRYREAFGKGDSKEIQACTFDLLKYCEIDLGDGRWAALDTKDFINQHFHNPKSLIDLQKGVMEVNFGFLADSVRSDS